MPRSRLPPPPTPLNSATSCGIAVICTRRAAGTPKAVPMTIATRIAVMWSKSSATNVTTTAMHRTDGADQVAASGVLRRRQPLESQDEAQRRDQVGELHPGLVHASSPFAGDLRCVNICSMRSVTTNPPTMFTVASTTAASPSHSSTSVSA